MNLLPFYLGEFLYEVLHQVLNLAGFNVPCLIHSFNEVCYSLFICGNIFKFYSVATDAVCKHLVAVLRFYGRHYKKVMILHIITSFLHSALGSCDPVDKWANLALEKVKRQKIVRFSSVSCFIKAFEIPRLNYLEFLSVSCSDLIYLSNVLR